ncbi:MAG: MarR family transcriptional regulator [Candidatus Cloacimonetes bacterium]|nr:MarR family transcriptional regulator [Candidatus Cloacimonadota bacterium]
MTNSVEKLHGLITRLQVVMSEIDYTQKACLQAGKMECALLNYLFKVDIPTNMNELARVLNVSHSRVTRIMDNLVLKSLVIRKPSEDDRRCWYAIITDKGKKIAKNSQQTIVNHQEKISKIIPEKEIENVITSLKKYVDAYEKVLKETYVEI